MKGASSPGILYSLLPEMVHSNKHLKEDCKHGKGGRLPGNLIGMSRTRGTHPGHSNGAEEVDKTEDLGGRGGAK